MIRARPRHQRSIDPYTDMKSALGGEAVYHCDPLAGRRIETCEGRAGVIKRDAPSDQSSESASPA
jgi:hypothetical protein